MPTALKNIQTKNLISIGLLVLVPIAIVAEKLEWDALIVFGLSAFAIIPLAVWLSKATEEIAVVLGPSIGGLLNAVFGNATELIIALVALKGGLVDIVKASITGTIISNLLLVMGLSMFLGGLRYKEQTFQPMAARVNGSTMTLAVTAIVLPAMVITTSNVVEQSAITNLSIFVAVILIVVYGFTLLFSLKTHSYLYDVGVVELEGASEDEAATEQDKHSKPNLSLWVGVLLVATIGIAFVSEIFVGAVEEATK